MIQRISYEYEGEGKEGKPFSLIDHAGEQLAMDMMKKVEDRIKEKYQQMTGNELTIENAHEITIGTSPYWPPGTEQYTVNGKYMFMVGPVKTEWVTENGEYKLKTWREITE